MSDQKIFQYDFDSECVILIFWMRVESYAVKFHKVVLIYKIR